MKLFENSLKIISYVLQYTDDTIILVEKSDLQLANLKFIVRFSRPFLAQNQPHTSAKKPSYGVPKTPLLVWKLEATNMMPLLRNSCGIGGYASSTIRVARVPHLQCNLHAINVSCTQKTFAIM